MAHVPERKEDMSSSYSFNQIVQLVKKLEVVGWDAKRVTQLGQATPGQLAEIEAVLDGRGVKATWFGDTTNVCFLLLLKLSRVPQSLSASEVFTGFLDPVFALAETDDRTEALPVMTSLYKMKKGGKFKTLFDSINHDWRSLCLSPRQITWFCHEHHEHFENNRTGSISWDTFFLFERDNKPVVASVNVSGHGLKIRVDKYSFDNTYVLHHSSPYQFLVKQSTD